jgi:hypothetical protein
MHFVVPTWLEDQAQNSLVTSYRSGTMRRTSSFRIPGIIHLIGRVGGEILCFPQILPRRAVVEEKLPAFSGD